MERNEAYGHGTGVPSSFGEPVGFNYMNYDHQNHTGGTSASAPACSAFINNNNYSNLLVGNNNNNISPFYFNPSSYIYAPINTNITPTFPTSSPILSPHNIQLCTNTTNTNPIGFPGVPFTASNYNTNTNINPGVQNYGTANMLVNSVQQPVPTTNNNIASNLDQTNHDAQMISMGVNSADHLGSLVFSDGETSGARVNRKKRNVTRNKRSSFLPFNQFNFNQLQVPLPARPQPAAQPQPDAAQPQPDPQTEAARQRVRDDPRFKLLFQKQLQNSDVNNLKRMVIPKKPAELYLPKLNERSGISIEMAEIDGSEVWTFSYRFWPNNKSRMYILENTGEFVNKHKLRSGDFITVYEDTETKKYVIEATKPIRNDVVHKPKPKKVRNHSQKDQKETDKDTPMSDVHDVAPSLEAGNGLPSAATNEIQSLDNTAAGNYMQGPNNGFEPCISSGIIDNVLNFPNPVDNTTSLIYNDMNFPNDYLFNMWEQGTSSNQSAPSFQNLSFDDILKGM